MATTHSDDYSTPLQLVQYVKSIITRSLNNALVSIGCSFKFILIVGVEESIVNVPITDQLFKSNLIFCVVCVVTLKTDEWCVHNRRFNANFEDKFK
jgi:hypothetical protein